MARVLRTPDPQLRPLFQREPVGFARDEPEAVTWLAAPRAIVTVIVDLEGELSNDGRRMPDAWVGALGGAPSEVTVSARYAGLDLKLTPLGAYRLLGLPMTELADDAALPLGEAFGRAGTELADRLRAASSWDERLAATEAFVRRRAYAGPEPAPFVEWAWRRIAQTRGRITVSELAAEIGCSRRHLQAKFNEQVGLAPKTVLRLTRFERVCGALQATPRRWADLAAEAGYADQAHLNREFRDLAGTTPSEYIARLFPNVQASGRAGG